MGRILAPYGVKGWVKIEPYSTEPGSLNAYPAWWVGRNGDWQEFRVAESALHSGNLVARFEGCIERNAALALKGSEVAVQRELLPRIADNEFYWADLVGLRVVNEQNEELGKVAELFEHGAHPVMRLIEGKTERLLPFVPQVVKQVDMAGGCIRVVWGLDW